MVASMFRSDPTRLGLLRKKSIRLAAERFDELSRATKLLVVDQDVFGLRQHGDLVTNAVKGRWAYLETPEKLKAFQTWLQEQVDAKLLRPDRGGDPWMSQSVTTAYESAISRAHQGVKKSLRTATTMDREVQFAEWMKGKRSTVEAMRLLHTRQYNLLKGVTDAQSAKMGHILATGFANKQQPSELAAALQKVIKGSRYRAETIVLTEISNAHVNGLLDSYDALGVEGVQILAEWRCGSSPCKLCSAMRTVVLTIKEARGLLPRHPRCQCSFDIHTPETLTGKQVRTRSRIQQAVAASVKAETGKKSVREAKRSSTWKGATLQPTTKRKKAAKPLGYPAQVQKLMRVVNVVVVDPMPTGTEGETT